MNRSKTNGLSVPANSRSIAPHRGDFFAHLENEFNSFFDGFFNKSLMDYNTSSFPKMDMYEEDGSFYVNVAASGMTKENIEIEVQKVGFPDLASGSEGDILHIRGKMSEQFKSSDDAKHYVKELRHSTFRRSVRLPENIEGDPVATMKDGILSLKWNLVIPTHPVENRKRIEIS